MSRYVLTPEAQHDLREIREFILREGGIRATRHVMAALVGAFRLLARSSGLGHRREGLTGREEIQFFGVFAYLVVFRTDRKPLIYSPSSTADAMCGGCSNSDKDRPSNLLLESR